jgi:hypothetical protein
MGLLSSSFSIHRSQQKIPHRFSITVLLQSKSPQHVKPTRRGSKETVSAAVLLACFILSLLAARHILSPRVIVRAVAPNGIEFCMVQTIGEPFNTSAHYRKPGGSWGWFYFDHEDWYWARGRARIAPGEKAIKIFRQQELVATFNWETEAFTRLGLGRINRTHTGAQHWLPAGKDPWDKF